MKGLSQGTGGGLLVFLCCVFVAGLAAAQSPTPPPGIPPDWVDAWEKGNLLFTDQDEPTDDNHQAYVGNGYLATVVGSQNLYVSGVFNGATTSSTRARFPATNALNIAGVVHTGSALNVREGVFYRRSTYNPVCIGCPQFDIEQRWYAHRYYPSLLIHELEISSTSVFRQTFTLTLRNNSGPASKDISVGIYTSSPEFSIYVAANNDPETPQTPRTVVGVAATNLPEFLNLNANRSSTTYYYITAIRTTHDSDNPLKDVYEDYLAAKANKEGLLALHIAEWERVWEAGIEVGGRFELSQSVNSSLYYVLSSIRAGSYESQSHRFKSSFAVPSFSLSPGSLATTGYKGHTFWDADMWVFPSLALFYPEVGRNVLNYRFNRRDNAAVIARGLGYKGFKFPWESALSGVETCSWPPGLLEIHLMGDIGIAVEQYWRMTLDQQWLLDEGLPLIEGLAEWWVSRVVFNKTLNAYTILGVVGPDEYAAAGVDNNAYTNALASVNLEFAIEIYTYLGKPVDPQWRAVSSNIYIPLNATGNFHPEFDGYPYRLTVKQADTILMGYPALYQMPKSLRKGDLAYYESVTDRGGPAMSWAMFAIGWLEVGEFDYAAKYFNLSYQLNINKPFNAWQEGIGGGCPHFLTGAGGFLQTLWAGFGGVRVLSDGLHLSPVLPESATSIKYRSLHYAGSQLDIRFDQTSITFTLTEAGPTGLAVVPKLGKPAQLLAGVPVPFNLSAGDFLLQSL